MVEQLVFSDGGVVIATEPVTLESVYRARYAPLVRLARQIVGSTAIAEELTHSRTIRRSDFPVNSMRPDPRQL